METEKIKCIIIEDNPAFVKMLEYYARKTGILEIIGTHDDSISSAVSIFRNKPDLVFLDVNISGLNGLEMLETLDYRPKTIVISNHSAEFLDYYKEVKVDAFLQKPVKFEDLMIVLEGIYPGRTFLNVAAE